MTAFAINTGGLEYFDQKSGGSVNATLDVYTISNQSTLVVRTDSNACLNHSVAFGSLDTVAFSGTGGTLHFDPTYVRVIAYTGGSGNSPAFGATISQGGVSGVFLGAWTNWQSECIVPAAAIGATGFIKIGGVTGGNFAAGALTGITATCSGADVQGWIEVRGAETATITVPRIGKVTSTEAWFELGTTNGTRGQVIACPTTASFAGVFAGCQIETAAGSGVYEWYTGVGSQVALATTRTDASCKFVWSTTTGIRIGNDGTNGVGFLPVTGCKVRIPAIILTNCTRTAGGSGARVLPNATLATRQEFITTNAGYIDISGVVSQWYMNFSQAFYLKLDDCAINDQLYVSEIATPFNLNNCLVSPTQAQVNAAYVESVCLAGGTVTDCKFWRFSQTTSSTFAATTNYCAGIVHTRSVFGILTLRTLNSGWTLGVSFGSNLTYTDCTVIGGRINGASVLGLRINNLTYYDHTLTTSATATNPSWAFNLSAGCADVVIDGLLVPNANYAPYNRIFESTSCRNIVVRNIGLPSAPLALVNTITSGLYSLNGTNSNIKFQRCYITGTRTNFGVATNSDTGIVMENCGGDYADTDVQVGLNTLVKKLCFYRCAYRSNLCLWYPLADKIYVCHCGLY